MAVVHIYDDDRIICGKCMEQNVQDGGMHPSMTLDSQFHCQSGEICILSGILSLCYDAVICIIIHIIHCDPSL